GSRPRASRWARCSTRSGPGPGPGSSSRRPARPSARDQRPRQGLASAHPVIYDDAPDLYDAHYLAYRDDVPFYTRLAADAGGPVLQPGAGTGRVTEALARARHHGVAGDASPAVPARAEERPALARAGHHVVAVDASPAMLARAEERLAAAGVKDDVRLLEADMRALDLGERFPLVVAPFNVLMHAYTLDDQDSTLSSVVRHLAD